MPQFFKGNIPEVKRVLVEMPDMSNYVSYPWSETQKTIPFQVGDVIRVNNKVRNWNGEEVLVVRVGADTMNNPSPELTVRLTVLPRKKSKRSEWSREFEDVWGHEVEEGFEYYKDMVGYK